MYMSNVSQEVENMDNEHFQQLTLGYMAKITQDLTEMKQDITEMKQDIIEMKRDITDMKRDIAGLKQGQTKLELVIENEIKPKIGALFEGQRQHTEQLNRIEAKLGEHDEFILKRIK